MRQNPKEKEELCNVYAQLLAGGRHYGELQTQYRIIASTWLLATFAAIGFLLSADNILPFDHLLGVVLISNIGIVGIYLIWYEDTVIQELLLDLFVIDAVRLENQNKWLPQVHNRFIRLSKGETVKEMFFIGCKTILLFIMGLSLVAYFYNISILLMGAFALICVLFNYVSSRYMLKKASKIRDYLEFFVKLSDR